MSARFTFRLLIALAWLVPALSFLLLQIPYSGTPAGVDRAERTQELFRQVRAQGLPDHALWLLAAVLFTLLLTFLVAIGLWCFHRWARIAYIPATLLYAFYLPFGTPYVPTAAGRVAEYLGYGLCGAVAAMAFLPPVASMFAPRKV